ncbi:protein SET DOMAIN GROUP 41-like [Tasmannia lanceolata]|uniref:protein SET DOMAIN GROUP 41-like n=1 Tax=Tasmannia lanceolata TaxID=3420 RepID=UPI004064BACC
MIRSIKSIKKGEEVCVAYADLLQPKAIRQSELWEKYRFVCCCDRCNSSPPTYVDRILQVGIEVAKLFLNEGETICISYEI